MKATAIYIAFFAIILLIIPMFALYIEIPSMDAIQIPVHQPTIPANNPSGETIENPNSTAAEQAIASDTIEEETQQQSHSKVEASTIPVTKFRILDQSSGRVRTVSVRDFVRGAVAAEMPASFHPEALKAQAVAAHTLALNHHYTQKQNPDPALRGADFMADPDNLKVYVTEDSMRSFYGEKADYYWGKICEAADSVISYVLEYDEEPIVAAYHAISAGKTEDASNVWVGSAPYLIPVNSEGDILAPGYETTITLSSNEVQKLLHKAFDGIKLADAPADWFGIPLRSSSGYVTKIRVGDREVHGKDLRTALDLRSHNFTIQPNGNDFIITVYGYGHGVGLSQQGADYLARQGESFDAILRNYYPGTKLKQINFSD